MRNLSDNAKKNKQAYDQQFIKNNYDRAELTLPKGSKAIYQAHAAAHGESLNAFINRAIRQTIAADNAAQDATQEDGGNG